MPELLVAVLERVGLQTEILSVWQQISKSLIRLALIEQYAQMIGSSKQDTEIAMLLLASFLI